MSPAKNKPKQEAPTKKFGGFRPVNDKCIDCDKEVGKGDRQELVIAENGDCRRMCGTCIKKREGQ